MNGVGCDPHRAARRARSRPSVEPGRRVDLRGAAARGARGDRTDARSTAATATPSPTLVRAHVERHQRSAESASGRRFAKPGRRRRAADPLGGRRGAVREVLRPARPGRRGQLQGGTDHLLHPRRASGGRQRADLRGRADWRSASACSTDAGVAVDLEHPVVVHQVWGNRVRASVSIPPVSDCLDGTFRIYRPHRTDLVDLVELDSLTSARQRTSWRRSSSPQPGCSITGGPGSGKSTFAAALLRATPATTITRIVQEVRELDAPHLPGGRWSPEAGGHTIRSLVRRSLAVRPATARRRRDPRRGGVRAAEGGERGVRVRHYPARQLGSARDAVARDGGA